MSINPFNPIKVNPFNPFTPSSNAKPDEELLYTPIPKSPEINYTPVPKKSVVSSLLQPNKNVVSPFSFATNQIKAEPFKLEVPQLIHDVVKNQKQTYQEGTKVFQDWETNQKRIMDPVVDAIRKPIVATVNAGKAVSEVPIKIMNHPIVKDNMVEVTKRTSGTGIVSMVQAIGPKTFEEAYKANRQAQAGDPSVLNKFLYQLGDSLPQTAIGVALNFVPYTGRPLSAAYWSALSASEQIESTGQVESLRPIAIDVLGDRMLGNSIEAMFKAPAKTLWHTIKKNFVVEGGTEVAQDLLKMQDAYLRAKTPEEKAAILKKAKEYFTSGQILMTLGVGGISGAAIGTAAYTLNQTPPVVNEEQAGGMTPVPPGTTPPPPPGGSVSIFKGSQTPTSNLSIDGNAVPPENVYELMEKENQEIQAYVGIEKEDMIPLKRDISLNKMMSHIVNSYVMDGEQMENIENLMKSFNELGYTSIKDSIKLKYTPPQTLRRPSSPPAETSKPVLLQESNKKTIFNNALPMNKSADRRKFEKGIDTMVAEKTILPEDADIIKTVFEDTKDSYLGYLNFKRARKNMAALGHFAVPKSKITGLEEPHKNEIVLRRNLAKNFDASRIFMHEFGHSGYKLLLSEEEQKIVKDVYREIRGRVGAKSIFESGLGGNTKYHAKDEKEFFAESFAEYVMENKVPAEKMRPLLQRIALKFYEGLKRLVNRGKVDAIIRLRPIFEKILSGNKDTPLSVFYNREPVSFKQQLQQMFSQMEATNPTETPIQPAPQEPAIVEPKKNEPPKRTPYKKRINWFDVASTPMWVLRKLGLRENYQELKIAEFEMFKENKANFKKIESWMKQVPTKEGNERIFNYLDGQKVELNETEMKVAQEIKVWLESWADRLGIDSENRITDYITHIFPKDETAEIPEEIAAMIRKKIPGEVYNPFLLERFGAEGYKKDTWTALEIYAKRATRKVHMDPALKNLQEKVGAGKEVSEATQIEFVEKYVASVNMRPTSADVLTDNTIKKFFGNRLGPRPTRVITLAIRKTISAAKIAGSFVTFAKNLTQSKNTFAELGTKYTAVGYINLVTKGAKELEENGVLLNSANQDLVYSAVKKWAERTDKILYFNMNASELINRGAAYFGAKAKFLAGKVSDKDFKLAFGQEKPEGYIPSEQDAITYGKFIAEKTQFVFGAIDTPSGINSDFMKTLVQYGTYPLKQQEFAIRLLTEKEWGKFARYLTAQALFIYWIGSALGIKWEDEFYKLNKPPIWIFIESLYQNTIGGKDKYENSLSTENKIENIGKSLFTNVVPMGAQINRSIEGFNTVNAGKSTTKGGNFQYKVDKTPMNYIRGTLFGKYNLTESKEYYKKKDEKASKKKSKTTNSFNPI